MAFYDIFEGLCEERGVTPTRAARENDIAQSSVATWKKRGSIPKAATIRRLADYFGVSVDYLLGTYTPMMGITISGDSDDIATVKELVEKTAGFTYKQQCEIYEVNSRNRLEAAYARLNLIGHQKVADYAEELAKGPKYLVNQEYPCYYPPQASPSAPSPAPEVKDTTPTSEGAERPPEGE